jgi:hypothetical protein
LAVLEFVRIHCLSLIAKFIKCLSFMWDQRFPVVELKSKMLKQALLPLLIGYLFLFLAFYLGYQGLQDLGKCSALNY